ncbi:MAG: hypothetical protein SF053_20545 [Bacteroidia bacterium]|nr:hypothetical protein [Bacteroidia bacterium]
MNRWPSWAAWTWAPVTAGLMAWAWTRIGAGGVYPLDDSYIHLAIARTLSEAGVWGLSPDRPAFSSSSPLFTLLLAGIFKVLGYQAYAPLALNILAGIGWTAWLLQATPRQYAPGLGLVLMLAPLPLLVLCGMEHVLHAWCWMGAWRAVTRSLSGSESSPAEAGIWLVLAAGFRYETLFLGVVVCLAALRQRRVRWAIGWGLACILPAVVAGLYALGQGQPFLPLSVMGKGHLPGGSWATAAYWLSGGVQRLYENPFMLTLLLMAWLPGVTAPDGWKRTGLGLLIPAVLLHIIWAEVGGYRYEAYLVVPVLWGAMGEIPRVSWRVAGMILLLVFPLGVRMLFFGINYPLAVQNIWHQQLQTAHFLEQHYPGTPVALNDIGAAAALARVSVTDLAGIGDHEVQQLRLTGHYSPADIAAILSRRGVRRAVVHDIWVGELIPADWIPVLKVTIPDNFICADAAVTWYAADPETAARLQADWQRYRQQLPAGVQDTLIPLP